MGFTAHTSIRTLLSSSASIVLRTRYIDRRIPVEKATWLEWDLGYRRRHDGPVFNTGHYVSGNANGIEMEKARHDTTRKLCVTRQNSSKSSEPLAPIGSAA